MKNVRAKEVFIGSEGRWKAGEIREVDNDRADKLIAVGLVEEVESEDMGEPEGAQAPEGSLETDPAKRETKPSKRKIEIK